jgi:hypothetical protein
MLAYFTDADTGADLFAAASLVLPWARPKLVGVCTIAILWIFIKRCIDAKLINKIDPEVLAKALERETATRFFELRRAAILLNASKLTLENSQIGKLIEAFFASSSTSYWNTLLSEVEDPIYGVPLPPQSASTVQQYIARVVSDSERRQFISAIQSTRSGLSL